MALSDAGLVVRYGLSESSFTQFDDSGPHAAHLNSNNAGSSGLATAGTSPHKRVDCLVNNQAVRLCRYLADSGDPVRTAVEGAQKIRIVIRGRWGTVPDFRTWAAFRNWGTQNSIYGWDAFALFHESNKLFCKWIGDYPLYDSITRPSDGDTVDYTYEFQIDTTVSSGGRMKAYLNGVLQFSTDTNVALNSSIALPADMQISLFNAENDNYGWRAFSPPSGICYFAVHVGQSQSTTLAEDTHTALATDDDTFGATPLTQSMATTLGGVSVAIAQAKNGALGQSMAFTLDGVTASVSQGMSRPQALASTLDGISVAIAQDGATGSLISVTGISIPIKTVAGSDVRFEWGGDSGTTLPPRRNIAMGGWRWVDPAIVGYYAQFFFVKRNTGSYPPGYYWFGAHPYPCAGTFDGGGDADPLGNSTLSTHFEEIAGMPSADYIESVLGANIPTVKGAWRNWWITVNVEGSFVVHRYWPDIQDHPEEYLEKAVSVTNMDSDTPEASAALVWGASFWTQVSGDKNEEPPAGKHFGLRICSDGSMTTAEMQQEGAAALSGTNTAATAKFLASQYYINDRLVTSGVVDITDKSGEANHPAWMLDTTARPTTFTEDIPAIQAGLSQDLAATLDGVMVAVAQEMGHSQSVAASLDGVSVAAAQNLGRRQALSVALDGVQVSIAQSVSGNLTQSISAGLDGISVSAAQTLGRDQALAMALDGISVSVSQALSSAIKTQSVGITLDGVSADIVQVGRPPENDVQLLGGGPGSPRKKKIEKGSYWERLLSPPLADRLENIKPEAAQVIEELAAESIEAPKPAPIKDLRKDLRNHGIAYKEAYKQIYLQLVEEMRQLQEIEDEDAVSIAFML